MPISYACGITTVSSRVNNGLLQRTLDSLSKAGFDKPTIFIDGPIEGPVCPSQTSHSPSLGTFSNWYLGALELYIKNPKADRYLMFQDDMVTYLNLRDYLDSVDCPDDRYFNLYTFDGSKKQDLGWSVTRNAGKGAVALMFSRHVLGKLLTSNLFINRTLDRVDNRKDPEKNLDGAIVNILGHMNINEYVHMPSLVQHTGKVSSIGHNVNQYTHASSFLGEDHDAKQLIGINYEEDVMNSGKNNPERLKDRYRKLAQIKSAPPKPKKVERIGLSGYCCQTGLGQLNYATATYAEIDKWLIKPHPSHRLIPPPNTVDTMVCIGNRNKMARWLSTIDTLVFFETVVTKGLLELAHGMRKRIICVPMIEWLPEDPKSWTKHVDLFICPTKQCYDMINAQDTPYPSVYFPWPIDTEKFKYRQRTKVEKFLFINGKGGWSGRKGGDVIRKAKELWPEMPLVVISQSNEKWPEGTEIIPPPKDNANLYDVGDILLAPHTVDGIGLEPLEAMATGMPVLTTEGKPWNENRKLGTILADVAIKKVKREMPWYKCKPEHLVRECQQLLKWEGELEPMSQAAREWAESRSWNIKADEFTKLIRYGVPTNMGDKV